MSAAHTPGPWLMQPATKPNGVEKSWDCAITADGKVIAEAFQIVGYTDGENKRYLQVDVTANAMLIAAAPDLAAALLGVLRVADRATQEFDAARAALAKAGVP